MKFRKVTLSSLSKTRNNVYVGGSHLTDVEDFKAYISGKRLRYDGDQYRADEVYSVCSYAESDDARADEDDLFRALCDAGHCVFNTQRRSNIYNDPGFVYVLHN